MAPSTDHTEYLAVDKLSEELKLCVLDCVYGAEPEYGDDWPDSIQDVYNLCLVRPFHRAATEYLYRSGPVTGDNLALVMRTFREQPSLARLTRGVSIHEGCQSILDHGESLGTTKKVIEGLDLAEDARNALRRLITYDHRMGILALLLVLVPNIQRLSCSGYTQLYELNKTHREMRTPFWELPLSLCRFTGKQYFQHVRALELDMTGVSIRSLLPVFAFPSLQRLEFYGLYDSYCDLDPETIEYVSNTLSSVQSGIEVLFFHSGYIMPQFVNMLVRACRNLVTLCIAGLDTSLGGHADFLTMGREILSSNPTLKRLELKFPGEDDDSSNFGFRPLGSLRGFAQLEDLSLSASLLYHHDSPSFRLSSVLPPNLKTLYIEDISPQFGRALFRPRGMLKELAEQRQAWSVGSALSRLSSIELAADYDRSSSAVLQKEVDAITGALESVGIELCTYDTISSPPHS